MKIVQTFWSLPMLKSNPKIQDNRKSGGWLDKRSFYMSWALSCLQFKKFYENVELVTDRKGKEILIDILNLPYVKVSLELENINKVNPDLWAIPKIYAYALQNEPFIHADGDVFIWDKLQIDHHSSLIVQNEEINLKYNVNNWELVKRVFNYIPKYMASDETNINSINSYNAGIFAGNDINFIQKYTNEVFMFIRRNKKNIDKTSVGELGLIYEQYLFACLSRFCNKKITTLLNTPDMNFEFIKKFHLIYSGNRYIHVFGANSKKSDYISHCVSRFLMLEHPEYYNHICHLCNRNIL